MYSTSLKMYKKNPTKKQQQQKKKTHNLKNDHKCRALGSYIQNINAELQFKIS